MKLLRTTLFVIAVLAANSITPSFAQIAPQIEPFSLPVRPVTLTQDIIKRFLYSFAAVGAQMKQEAAGNATSPEAAARLDRKAAEYGFKDFNDWGETTRTIMVTYHWLTNPDPREEVEKAIATIPSTPNLTDKQKADMIDGLKAGLEAVEKARPSPENLAIVKKHLSSIKPLYKQWTSL
ncbi:MULTISPECIES: hypothetical protein [unclassified Phyllobacterium]|uniref:hypothetical protein n=1 Tax=Phyllobacterium TaxID=28100 RepID=UPI000DDEE016|nr:MULTISPECIES: hypothetical protein [unclassified Phyllobacterium]MBA8904089.1 hypothetical protein [Phyllobacterium sp. P30BS-XVII]UGX87698.1 hypothetical protein LLE53_007765 [Phyllobacterium sp. T1293]